MDRRPCRRAGLVVFGFPSLGGRSATTVSGHCAGHDHDDATGLPWIKFTGFMWQGHSGGPCINAQGQVVGWNVRSATPRTGGGHLIHVRPIGEGRECIAAARAKAEGTEGLPDLAPLNID